MKPEVVVKDKELVQRLESEWLVLLLCRAPEGEEKGGATQRLGKKVG